VAEAIQQIRGSVDLIGPEIILLVAMCLLFVIGPLLVSDAGEAPPRLRNRMGLLSLAAIVIAWIAWYQSDFRVVQAGMFRSDSLVWYVRGLSLSIGFLLALVLWNQIDDGHSAEAHACLLAILAGVNFVAAANDLVVLFLALELVSIPTYVLLYLPRRDRLGGESTIKYFLLSVFSSSLVLYGMSWLYGVAGSTNFAAIQDALLNRAPHAGEGLLEIALALLVAGLCFRIAAVPFHFYAPDVFQGTTAANAALLSVLPKAVGLVALMRLIPLTGETEGRNRELRALDSRYLWQVDAGCYRSRDHVHRQPARAASNQPVPPDGLFQHRPRRLHARGSRDGRYGSRRRPTSNPVLPRGVRLDDDWRVCAHQLLEHPG
jgi:NADH-quinone oxidoreductase subunit N